MTESYVVKIYCTVIVSLSCCNTAYAYGPNDPYEPIEGPIDPSGFFFLLLAVIFALPCIAYKKYVKLKQGNETNIIGKAIKESMSDCGMFAVTFWLGGIVLVIALLLMVTAIGLLSADLERFFASYYHGPDHGVYYLIAFIWWVICLFWTTKKPEKSQEILEKGL